ncbi:MAG: hypothetical protein KAG72_11925 [Abyssibacter sp.]|jgi:outer membrane lipoprotein SlyB|nr:hypothetical protein [Abyssibacter sp.]MCK5860047.1 hypothetical protein [Abyssibacter sp.]
MRTRRIVFFSMACVAWLSGCANRGPIVDTQGVSQAQYAQDLAQCEQYAEQVDMGSSAAGGALGGAAIGALLGSIFGNSDTAKRTGGAGAVVGGAKGAAQGAREKDQVVKNCLRGRGYRVLN